MNTTSSALTVLICDDEPLARQRSQALLQDIQAQMPTRVLAEAENGKSEAKRS